MVDDTLATSDARIFAIGDCANHRGMSYGIVGPGYAMADVLVQRWAGDDTALFEGGDLSCSLKVAGVDVSAVGQYEMEARHISVRGDGWIRTLIVNGRQLVGATAVGAWPSLPMVRELIRTETNATDAQLKAFEETGELPTGERLPVLMWNENAVICQCVGVRRGALSSALAGGARDLSALSRATGAGTVCGSCEPLLCEITGAVHTPQRPTWHRLLALSSAAALCCGLITCAVPPPGFAATVQGGGHQLDMLWREGLLKQITGFTLVGLSVLGMLLSLRKRTRWFKLGSFHGARALHTTLGLGAVLALWAHTGLRFGSNLNFALMSVFSALCVVGATTGVLAFAEGRDHSGWTDRARVLRGRFSRLHVWLLWPLPVLLIFHVLSVYYF